MNIEEVIEQLKWYFECYDGISANERTKEAYKIAVQALVENERYRHSMFIIGETCVNASKGHISSEGALESIRRNIFYTRPFEIR